MNASRDIEAPQPPSYLGLMREALGLLELPRLLWSAPTLAAQPRGRGEAVLVFPGYGAGDASTWTLRRYLRGLGWDARGWGIGRNDGDVEGLIPRATQCAERAARRTGAPVRLIGWSLGGYLAREAARESPAAVAQVITLGSPVVGGPKYTAVADVYRRRGFDLDAIEAAVAERNRVTLRVPVTAIYSRSDGVVAWRACIDEWSPRVEHREVRTTHVGLGFSAEVYGIVARTLAGSRTKR
jgi:pimeloyl-ACP methyl ester carboxylesterase